MKYIIGANYWASNAGTEMWCNFDVQCIKNDLKTLRENGIEYLRVFPNWRDFQPVKAMYGANNYFCEYRMSNEELPANQYYLDEEMLERFSLFCDLCEEADIKVIPSLITGWMSGRMFIPPALEGKKLFTDSAALNFEQKFIEGFVKRFKDRSVITAWDVGNECSCMSPVEDSDRAEFWTAFISNTIRSFDPSRTVISGVHSMGLQGNWTVKGQSKYCDVLVTHPYPYWGSHTNNDKVSSMRTLLHATALHNLYKDIGQKPCFVNEIGTMGPMVCDDETSADFMRVNLYSSFAHGAVGIMWWCANEQTNLTTAPYTWNMCETELGLLDSDGQPKPVLKEIKKFSDWLKDINLTLPAPKTDAVCILTRNQDHWGVAYMTYILSVMAGFNIKFCYADEELPDSDIYFMPSVSGHWVMPGERYAELKERVKKGATLYISNKDAILSEFNELAGVVIKDSDMTNEHSEMNIEDNVIEFSRTKKYYIVPKSKENVIACEKNGEPVFVKNDYGNGKVFYLNFPLEEMLINGTNRLEGNQYLIYKTLLKDKLGEHCVSCDIPYVGITHHYDGDDVYAVIINYSNNCTELNLKIHQDFKISSVIKGDIEKIEPFATVILRMKKNTTI